MRKRLSEEQRRPGVIFSKAVAVAAMLVLLVGLATFTPQFVPTSNLLPTAGDAHAQWWCDYSVDIDLSPTSGPAGTLIDVTGSGFQYWGGEAPPVVVYFIFSFGGEGGEARAIGKGNVDEKTNISITDCPIPADAAPGSYAIRAVQEADGTVCGTAEFQVTSVPPSDETVATPSPPTGPSFGEVDESLTYSWGYTLSSAGHPAQIRIDWGDGTMSDWFVAGAQDPRTASHAWDHEGTYFVKARARCAWHPGIVSAWSAARKVTISPIDERVTTPSAPTGPSTGEEEETLTFSTGDATSNLGHDLEYRFDWGDRAFSEWSSSTTGSHSWSKADTYTIKAEARCAQHTDAVSEWSDGAEITIVVPEERISTPAPPSGPSAGGTGGTLTYTTGGATSNLGHVVVYRFDWADGTFSEWSSSGSDSHAWLELGTYNIRAQARCAWHDDKVSEWSEATAVVVGPPGGETVSKPRPPDGPLNGDVDRETAFSTGGSSCSLGHPVEYRFNWGDTEFSEWSSSSSDSHSWAEEGTYTLRAQARCAVNTGIVSAWSDESRVQVTLPFVLSDLTVAPAEVDPGETVTVAVHVSNIGIEERTQLLELSIDGEVVVTEEVTLQGGSSTDTYFTVSREAAGDYDVLVGDNDGEFTVRASVAWSVVGGTIAGLIVLALIVLLIRRLLKSM